VAVERFLPDVDRTRRAAGWFMIAAFGVPLLWLASVVVELGRANSTAVVLFLVLSFMLALGARLAFRPQEYLEVDLESRTFAVIRKGKRAAAGALDALGPLEVRMRTRVVGSEGKRRTIIEYVVRAAVHSNVDLYVMKTPGKARQKMEGIGRAWRLPCKSLGGAVRPPDALDTPLHERLRGDSAARKAVPLSPDWGLRIKPAPMGYAMVSTHRSWVPLQMGLLFLVLGLVVLGGSFHYGVWDEANNGDPFAQVFAALVSVMMLGMVGTAAAGARNTFFPGTVHIDDRGVTYRGRRMRFKHIEEVTAGAPIEIVGDGRILKLAETFCPPAATAAVVHELQRLIVEVASSHES